MATTKTKNNVNDAMLCFMVKREKIFGGFKSIIYRYNGGHRVVSLSLAVRILYAIHMCVFR